MLFVLAGTVLIAFLASMCVLIPALQPSIQDVHLLFLFMGGSGGLTIVVVYVLYTQQVMQWSNSLRWTLWSIILLTVLLVFANVYFTAQLMFISPHDLVLTTSLLVFSSVIAAISAIFIAGTLTDRIRRLGDATQRLARGQLDTRLKARGNDELAQLAALFNQMAQELESVDQQKRLLEQSRRDLIAWVSHDLRTPLASIRAMNEAMLDGVVSDAETIRRYRHQIQREVEHLGHLIDDLFEISQIDAGHLKLTRKPTAIADLITAMLGSISARASQQQVTVTSQIEPGIAILNVAPDKIERVLYNLLDNAMHHTPPGGEIKLGVSRKQGHIEINVHNSGSVIAPEDLPHVFERFYRGERSRKQSSSGYRGTGLGLAIARSFVEAHGGSIRAISDAQYGTTISFTLP